MKMKLAEVTPLNPPRKLVKPEVVADYLNCSVSHVQAMARKNAIPYITIGMSRRLLRFDMERIARWAQERISA